MVLQRERLCNIIFSILIREKNNELILQLRVVLFIYERCMTLT